MNEYNTTWQEICDLSGMTNPQVRKKVVDALNELQGTHVGQYIFNAVKAKLDSPDYAGGKFQGKKILLNNEKDKDGSPNYILHNEPAGRIVIGLDRFETHQRIRHFSEDGDMFIADPVETVLHELAHAADKHLYDSQKKRVNINVEKENLVHDMQVIHTQLTLLPEHRFFKEAPSDIKQAIQEFNRLEKETKEGTEGTVQTKSRYGYVKKAVETYRNSLSEYQALQQRHQALERQYDQEKLAVEEFAIATVNTFRTERGLMHGKEAQMIDHRGHYYSSYRYNVKDRKVPDVTEFEKYREDNQQWVEKRGAAPLSFADYIERYGDRVFPDNTEPKQNDVFRLDHPLHDTLRQQVSAATDLTQWPSFTMQEASLQEEPTAMVTQTQSRSSSEKAV